MLLSLLYRGGCGGDRLGLADLLIFDTKFLALVLLNTFFSKETKLIQIPLCQL